MEPSIKDIQNKQKEILLELDRVCKLLDINYYLAAGTCLGAVRHKGFIPWDDDVDVFMHWKDVDVLLNNRDLFQNDYFLQTPETDPEVNTVHARLRDSTTTCIMKDDIHKNMNHGMFIDIYILYQYPDSFIKAHKLIINSFVHRVLQLKDGPENHGKFANRVGKIIVSLYGKRAEKKKAAVINSYKKNGGGKFYSIYFGEDISLLHSRVYPKEWFEEPTYLEFEGMQLPCPTFPREYCRFRYGEDYLVIPPKEKRKTNHDFIIVDFERPYTQYVG